MSLHIFVNNSESAFYLFHDFVQYFMGCFQTAETDQTLQNACINMTTKCKIIQSYYIIIICSKKQGG